MIRKGKQNHYFVIKKMDCYKQHLNRYLALLLCVAEKRDNLIHCYYYYYITQNNEYANKCEVVFIEVDYKWRNQSVKANDHQ